MCTTFVMESIPPKFTTTLLRTSVTRLVDCYCCTWFAVTPSRLKIFSETILLIPTLENSVEYLFLSWGISSFFFWGSWKHVFFFNWLAYYLQKIFRKNTKTFISFEFFTRLICIYIFLHWLGKMSHYTFPALLAFIFGIKKLHSLLLTRCADQHPKNFHIRYF